MGGEICTPRVDLDANDDLLYSFRGVIEKFAGLLFASAS